MVWMGDSDMLQLLSVVLSLPVAKVFPSACAWILRNLFAVPVYRTVISPLRFYRLLHVCTTCVHSNAPPPPAPKNPPRSYQGTCA